MIGYVCKYTPVEVFEAMGVEIRRIQPEVTNFNQADTLMHPNICSFTKSVLEDVLAGDYEGVVLTTCCDSIRRLYDVLKQQCPDKFLYLLDVPRKVNDFSTDMYRENILDMVHAYEAFSGKTFDEIVLKQLLERREAGQNLRTAPKNKASVHIGLMGARCSKGIIDLLENRGVDILFDMTCTTGQPAAGLCMAAAESGTLSSYGKGGQQRELYGRFQGSVRRYSLSYSAVLR